MTLVIKNADERLIREFKAEAVRRGLTLSRAFEEAVRIWLDLRDKLLVTEQDANNLAYESIEGELRKHRGKYAVIAGGKLMGLFDSLEEVATALRGLEPPVRNALVVKIGKDDKERRELEWLGGSLELENV